MPLHQLISKSFSRFFPAVAFIAMLFVAGCHETTVPASVPVKSGPVQIYPYGEALFALDPMNLDGPLREMQQDYSFFLGTTLDTLQVLQIRGFILDPVNRQLAEACKEKYPDSKFLEDDLGELFARCKVHLPSFEAPVVYTYISGLLYEMPVQYVDTVLIIGLDMYLGRLYEPYRAIGIPMFMSRRMEKQNILPDCARQVALSLIPSNTAPKTLLDYMVIEGKVLYAMDMLLPPTPDSLKIGYTASQYDWCIENEKNIWRMLIDQELLYSPDPLVVRKYMQDGPFTAGLPEGSPAMLGKWIGWQIVRSYMQKQRDIELTELFDAADSQIILSQSGYKPKK